MRGVRDSSSHTLSTAESAPSYVIFWGFRRVFSVGSAHIIHTTRLLCVASVIRVSKNDEFIS